MSEGKEGQAGVEGNLPSQFSLDHIPRALVGLALMMLGPGRYSVDRRLYGRKRIELGR